MSAVTAAGALSRASDAGPDARHWNATDCFGSPIDATLSERGRCGALFGDSGLRSADPRRLWRSDVVDVPRVRRESEQSVSGFSPGVSPSLAHDSKLPTIRVTSFTVRGLADNVFFKTVRSVLYASAR
jgi:hypothetical protein